MRNLCIKQNQKTFIHYREGRYDFFPVQIHKGQILILSSLLLKQSYFSTTVTNMNIL